jgi:stearoyl-CoA desaturase (delta-9 desaturase)
MLEASHSLKVVYEYSLKLQSIWHNKTASQESLISSLKEWCYQAEQSGIEALVEFASVLRGYRLQPA